MGKKMKASQFKAECLHVMENVSKTGEPIIITKRNIPIAKLVAIEEKEKKIFGKLKDTITFKKDILESTGEKWDADS